MPCQPEKSAAHKNLKRLAVIWARGQGYTTFATEVSLPNCGFRADVAAYRPLHGKVNAGELGGTAVFECKQSRSDLINDSAIAAVAIEQLSRLHERRVTLERLLRVHYPALSAGDSLFQEYETHDASVLNHRGYQSVRRRIGWLQRRIYEKNKFEKMVRYRCANLFSLVVSEGIVRVHELPLQWGLLEASARGLVLIRKAVWQEVSPAGRLGVLQRIASAGSRLCSRELEITFEDVWGARRQDEGPDGRGEGEGFFGLKKEKRCARRWSMF